MYCIRGKLKEDSKIKYQTCASLQTEIGEGCPGTKLNDQPHVSSEIKCIC